MKNHYIKYILALLLFGSNGIIADMIALSSYEIVLLRTVFGAAMLLAIFLLSGRGFCCFQYKKQLLFLAVSGMAMGANWMFLYEAYDEIGVAMASLACYCGPVIVMILSPLLFKERLTAAKIGGFAIVFSGVLLVNGNAFLQGDAAWGLFCGGMSAVMYALMVIANKKAVNINGLENACLQLFFALLTVAAFVGLKEGLLFPVANSDWLPILILGLINTGVGCYLCFSAINRLPAQSVAICGYIEPLSAVILAALLLQESMTVTQILGGFMILGGAVIGEVAFKRKTRRFY